MNEQLQVRCGPCDRAGKRLVIVECVGKTYRDRCDTDSAFHRSKVREAVINRFGLSDDAHQWLEERILAAADAEDEAGDCESFAAAKPVLVRMADVEARSIDWLWPNRIAAGRLTLLVGRPGDGKSFLTCDMASRVSTGSPWPDGSPCPRGGVILISAEDDPADTVRPRLDAHRADVQRVVMLRTVQRVDDAGRESEAMFSLSDVDALESALQTSRDCRLVVIDPIGSFLGGRTDAHRDNEVRSILAPVAALAEKYNAAVLVVCHTRKGAAASADDMAMGSRAFTGIARSVWHLSRDSDDSSRRLLLPGKSNIAAEQPGLAFTIAGDGFDGSGARVQWERDPVAMTADDALAKANGNGGESSALEEAVNWLRDQLRDGPIQGKAIQTAARADGIALRTLERAKEKLGVTAGPDGFRGPWVWRLPENVAPQSEDTASEATESASIATDFPEFANFQTLADSGDSGEQLADCGADWWQEPP